MEIPNDYRYTREHEWIKVSGNIGTCGITFHAQNLLTDIVFVELPAIGTNMEKMKPCAVVESVKSVSDVYCPVTGEIVETNKELETSPQLINDSPYNKGWIFKIKLANPEEINSLMDASAYNEFVETSSH